MVSDPGDWKLTSSPLLEAGKPGGSRCFVDGWTAEAGEWTTTCNRERYATKCDARYDKSTFGTCNTPWSTYIGTQERRMPFAGILNRDGPMTLKFKVEDPHFQFQLKKTQDAHLVILPQVHYKLSHRQAKFPRILSQNSQNDLQCQGQGPPFSIPAESIPGSISDANLVILAQICHELSCGQDKVYGRTDWQTDGHIDRQMDRRRQRQCPFGLKGRGVTKSVVISFMCAVTTTTKQTSMSEL